MKRILVLVILLSALPWSASAVESCCRCKFTTSPGFRYYASDQPVGALDQCKAANGRRTEGYTLMGCEWRGIHCTSWISTDILTHVGCKQNSDCSEGKTCTEYECAIPPPPAERAEEVLLPRLQIPLPTLQPFTEPFKTVTGEGKTVYIIKFLAEYIVAIYRYLVGIASIMAGVMIVWAGLKWLTSAGSPERIGEAKKKIAGALVGLVLVLGSYVILNIINPELTILKPLQVEYVPRILLPEEARMDADASDTELPTVNCAEPGFVINSIDGVDMSQANQIKKRLGPYKQLYQQAGQAAGVPWEMVAANHYTEANGNINQSTLNGGSLCNTQDDPTLLSWCPECNVKMPINDFICGAKLLKKKVAQLATNTTDLQAIKLAFCKYGGCPGSWVSCPDASHMVSALFDAQHSNYIKSGLDCISPNCDPNCTTDATIGPKNPRGCCAIKVLQHGQPPPSGASGSLCNTNQLGKCKIAEDARTRTYRYSPGQRSETNSCGTWIRQGRMGKFTLYAIIKKLSQQGQF